MDVAWAFGKAWLHFTQPTVIIPTIILLYFSQHRNKVVRSLLFLCLSLIINPNLKCLFKVPLPAHLNSSGFAFPSGHMQSACIFWGWLAYEFDNKIQTGLTMILLGGIGYWLTYFGYHQWHDILGAVIVFILLLILGHNLFGTIKQIPLHILAVLTNIISCPLSIPLAGSIYFNNVVTSQALTIGTLIGIFYSSMHYPTTHYNYLHKVGVAIVGSFTLWGAAWILSFIFSKNLLTFIICFTQALWISWGTEYTQKKILLQK